MGNCSPFKTGRFSSCGCCRWVTQSENQDVHDKWLFINNSDVFLLLVHCPSLSLVPFPAQLAQASLTSGLDHQLQQGRHHVVLIEEQMLARFDSPHQGNTLVQGIGSELQYP